MGGLIKNKAASATSSRAPTASRFQYRARSAEEVKARANRSLGGGDAYLKEGVEFFKSAPGDNKIRPLPPTWDEAQHYGLDLYVHYGIGPDRSTYICPNKMFGDECPICDERARAADAGEEGLAKALRPKLRVLVWLIDRKNESKGPLAWAMPAGADKDMTNAAVDPDDGAVVYVDRPDEEGADIHFKRSGEGIKTEYENVRVTKKRALSDDPKEADKWLQYVTDNPLPQILVVKTADELRAAYIGTTVEMKDGDDKNKAGDRQPAKLPPRGAARGAPAASAPKEPAAAEEELPSWEEVHGATEDEVSELVEAKGLQKEAEADDSITSLETLQDWVCKRLGIAAPPPPAAPAASGGSWKDRLAKNRAASK